MKVTQLNHVALSVRDVEASVTFYRDVLGLEVIARPAFDFPGAWLRLGADQELHLIGGRDGPVVSSSRGNHFALKVDDPRAWEARLRGAGVALRGPKRRPDGATQIFLEDPDGHVIELCAPADEG